MMKLQAYDFNTVEDLDLNLSEGGGFVKIEDNGSVKLRFVGDFTIVKSYWVDEEKTGYRTPVSTETPEKLKDVRPSFRVYFHVYDRADKELKIYDAPYTVFKSIKDLKADEDWTFKKLPPYDLTIYRDKGNKVSYRVVASPNKDELDKDVLAKVAELKPMPEILQEILKADEEKYVEKHGESMYAPVKTLVEDFTSEDKSLDISDVPF